ncbi:hypothetical protein DNTS_028486 [Danionella cerebrum]|uniref:C2H2-type domain-containing protein n=1 Tax=Danionella cerebrum TaxID=2873325 RepID=A0A553R7H3_9TELE|nr:hypothetical protein DNTS_028486 [Danionella translucida]TRY98130.1 hypothetical protein DNTS_028486 [Danionella translucida]
MASGLSFGRFIREDSSRKRSNQFSRKMSGPKLTPETQERDKKQEENKKTSQQKKVITVIACSAQLTQKVHRDDGSQEQPSSPHRKKEPRVYAPGSQEEKWQLQILAKGRASCPKCKSVGRKTVEGLMKHLEACKPHFPDTGNETADRAMKGKLRNALKRLGKLKCSREGCTGSFTSIMGYLYHMKKCGKEAAELEKLMVNCKHCGKAYGSRSGLEYHLKNKHGTMAEESEEVLNQKETIPERTAGGRGKRLSAQVAGVHMREIASQEMLKEWPKKKIQHDLVPDDRKYSRPGLPAFSQETLRKWKNGVKLNKKVLCPNKGCNCIYTSVSGLKAHLGICSFGEFVTGKYKCLICKKEFYSESGVKYHINSIHSQEWFVVSSKSKSSKLNKPHKAQAKEDCLQDPDLPSPNAGLGFPQVSGTWQDRETVMPMPNETTPEELENND